MPYCANKVPFLRCWLITASTSTLSKIQSRPLSLINFNCSPAHIFLSARNQFILRYQSLRLSCYSSVPCTGKTLVLSFRLRRQYRIAPSSCEKSCRFSLSIISVSIRGCTAAPLSSNWWVNCEWFHQVWKWRMPSLLSFVVDVIFQLRNHLWMHSSSSGHAINGPVIGYRHLERAARYCVLSFACQPAWNMRISVYIG